MFGSLFAKSRGAQYEEGQHRCFFCASPCSEKWLSSEYVRDSFTSRDTVRGGRFVCGGCVAALSETATIELPDGAVRENQKVRCYSWVATERTSIAATKAHRDWILDTCLNPPEPPFIICLSDSGQKHLLYRSVVCHSREVVTVSLELQRIVYDVRALRERYELVISLAAATGKPPLVGGLSIRQQMAVVELHGTDSRLITWLRVADEPLSQLAVWLCPGKKESLDEYRALSDTNTRGVDP